MPDNNTTPRDPCKWGLVDQDYEHGWLNQLLNRPLWSKRTEWLILIVLYGFIGIPYLVNILDKILSTYWD